MFLASPFGAFIIFRFARLNTVLIVPENHSSRFDR